MQNRILCRTCDDYGTLEHAAPGSSSTTWRQCPDCPKCAYCDDTRLRVARANGNAAIILDQNPYEFGFCRVACLAAAAIEALGIDNQRARDIAELIRDDREHYRTAGAIADAILATLPYQPGEN